MRFLSLELRAFGCFSDRHLDVSAGYQGLHVFLGANEAGKTTALAAIHDLLYGIHAQTPYAYHHAYGELRLSGRVRRADGEELHLVRRKGRGDTLTTGAGQVLAETDLRPFLGGVDSDTFQRVFGIDDRRLAAGAENLLRGHGDLGETLYAADLGLDVHGVLDALHEEAAALFRARAPSTRVPMAIARYQAALARMRQLQVPASAWVDLEQQIRQRFAEQEQVRAQRDQARAAAARLHRLQRALPLVAARSEVLAALASLGHLVALPADSAARRQQAEKQQAEAAMAQARAEALGLRLEAEQGRLRVPAELLDQAATIAALHARLDGCRHARDDLPGLLAEHQALEQQAVERLRALRPDLTLAQAEDVRLTREQRSQLQRLGSQQARVVQEAPRAAAQVARLAAQLERAQAVLASGPVPMDPAILRQSVERWRRQGDVEEQGAAVRAERAAEEAAVAVDLARLPGWQGSLPELEQAAVPLDGILDDYEVRWRDLDQEQARLEAALAGTDWALPTGGDDAAADVAQVRAAERRVRVARRGQWAGGVLTGSAAVLAGAWAWAAPTAQKELWPLAAGVATLLAVVTAWWAGRRRRRRAVAANVAAWAATRATRRQLLADWAQIWPRALTAPALPAEMRRWLERRDGVLERARRVRGLQVKETVLTAAIEAAAQELGQALAAAGQAPVLPGETLAARLDRGLRVARGLETAQQQRHQAETESARLVAELTQARVEYAAAQQALADWQEQWSAAVAPLGLSGAALATEVDEALGQTDRLLDERLRAVGLATRIGQIQEYLQAFAAGVEPLRSLLDGPPAAPEEVVETLALRVQQVQADAVRLRDLRQRQAECQELRAEAAIRGQQAAAELARLCAVAGCTDPAQLPAAEVGAAEARRLQVEADVLAERLREVAEGVPNDGLLAQAARANPDTIGTQIADAEADAERLDQRADQLRTELGALAERQRQMDGSDAAAAAAEEAQACLADVRTHAVEYLRLRLAEGLLRREVEQYRQTHQGPLLERASEHFCAMTLGAYGSLRADYDPGGQRALQGRRQDGRVVGVEAMSDGTRDQLYLALRLASLERYVAANEPMPFIVDDILIRFDDERAAAALRLLAGLSERTQVLFFTHHRRTAELAIETGGEVFIHNL
jgi:uncharacterized protein YhaN